MVMTDLRIFFSLPMYQRQVKRPLFFSPFPRCLGRLFCIVICRSAFGLTALLNQSFIT